MGQVSGPVRSAWERKWERECCGAPTGGSIGLSDEGHGSVWRPARTDPQAGSRTVVACRAAPRVWKVIGLFLFFRSRDGNGRIVTINCTGNAMS